MSEFSDPRTSTGDDQVLNPQLPPSGDSWDLFRAAEWGLDATTLPELLGELGLAGKPEAEQRERLREFTRTAPWIPAPHSLKREAATFLREG